MSHDNESWVDAEKERIAKEIQSENGLPWSTDGPPATAPEREEDETEEEFLAATAPRPGSYRIVDPKMTFEEAIKKQQKQKEKQQTNNCGAAASSTSSVSSSSSPLPLVAFSSGSSSIDPAWRAQVLQTLYGQGLEPAPTDYPDDAAFHIVPDIGPLVLVQNSNQGTQ